MLAVGPAERDGKTEQALVLEHWVAVKKVQETVTADRARMS